MDVKEAMETLSKAMKKDYDYAHSWHANISMMVQDAGCNRDVANEGASRFMKLAFDVDVTEENR